MEKHGKWKRCEKCGKSKFAGKSWENQKPKKNQKTPNKSTTRFCPHLASLLPSPSRTLCIQHVGIRVYQRWVQLWRSQVPSQVAGNLLGLLSLQVLPRLVRSSIRCHCRIPVAFNRMVRCLINRHMCNARYAYALCIVVLAQ
jgi:hypothetical protein